ncbi:MULTISPECIES: pseudaminic acid synthase [unclassified Thermosynechococcus]|uniref:pseudaminic acid synthase n=1 Tax=unclassified Thermosynechococcus TaxID=2622553 RepID=UPI002873C0EE|nr:MULTISPECIES: pseudaminic acid synthase [unclassified Thermosynechococcus]WNC32643.1 pseudaminic acid synthase [Thermosynechococcus sp. PKX95]WNC35172.1 pseudaminic acid synthase [Thermosynechococcus sp. PKX91]WNC37690.1 pseudaminic acid synthase [Thermosynechococcus sp. WL11]WNC40211.1 pseudaminic acid synthase [Thermosynechococcus sp. WL17]WNC42731.1 pseudaminic acid synthase [Thermosynechococcus sp. WL15]
MNAKVNKLQTTVPFIIAEMSGNHNQSLDRALEIVEVVAKSGAHALKLQTYTADTITLRCEKPDFFISDKTSLWQGEYLYNLYQKAYTPWEWHEPIFKRAKELGLIAFSTPFDLTAVDFLEELDCPIYKIASFENVDLGLIRRVAQTGKPIIMSTGMATLAELDEAVRTIRATGNDQIVLLKCTSTYPASPTDSNLRTIPHLRELFGCEVGLSDHTLGIGVAVAAVALGATVIEKHFTLSRAEGGVDAAFSLEPHEMKLLVEETQRAYQALGRVHYGPTEAEKKSLVYRRSLYFVKDMVAGEVITPECIRSIRPGYGLPPKYYEVLLGKRVNQAIERGTAVSWEHIG